jgi:hypothetical protein
MADSLADVIARLKADVPALADVPDAVLAAELQRQAQTSAGPSVADALGAPVFRTSNEKDASGAAVVRNEAPLGFLAPYLDRGMDLLRGATGLGDQGPAGPTWTNAGALLAALPVVAGVKRLATVAREGMPAVGEALQGIRAFHGSPHDFDAFTTAKIGTGEGAQAYGHGLYFAGNEAVAKQYRDDLGQVVNAFGGQATRTPAEDMAHTVMSRLRPNSTVEDAMRMVDEWADAGVFRGKNEGGTILDVKRAIADNFGKPLDKTVQGHMYEVNIKADPAHFLDWDAPLSAQSPQVQEAVQRMRDAGVLGDEFGVATTGEQLMRSKGVIAPEHNLKQAGVPGIKYLDQGSRAAGEGTRNYVVFDDQLIDILRKYGWLAPLAGASVGEALRAAPDRQAQ